MIEEREYLQLAVDDLSSVYDALAAKYKGSSTTPLHPGKRKPLDKLSNELARIEGRLAAAVLEDNP